MSSISSVSKILFTVINDYFTKTKDINSVLSFYNRDSTIIFNDLNEKKTEKFENMTQIENFLENLLKKDIHISNSSIQSIPGTDLFIIFTFVGDASGRKLHSTLYLELDTETNKGAIRHQIIDLT